MLLTSDVRKSTTLVKTSSVSPISATQPWTPPDKNWDTCRSSMSLGLGIFWGHPWNSKIQLENGGFMVVSWDFMGFYGIKALKNCSLIRF